MFQMAQKLVDLTRVLKNADDEWKLLNRTVKRIDQVKASLSLIGSRSDAVSCS